MLPGKSQHFQKWVTLGTWTMEQVSSTKKQNQTIDLWGAWKETYLSLSTPSLLPLEGWSHISLERTCLPVANGSWVMQIVYHKLLRCCGYCLKMEQQMPHRSTAYIWGTSILCLLLCNVCVSESLFFYPFTSMRNRHQVLGLTDSGKGTCLACCEFGSIPGNSYGLPSY